MDVPSLRVAITEACNLRCDYCPESGDSVEMQGKPIAPERFKDLLTAAVSAGFKNFSFTGGEPLITDRTAETTFQLAHLVNSLRTTDTGYTKLNTNGANVARHLDSIVGAGFDELKISLDTLSATTFKILTKRSEEVFERTIEGILAASDRVPVRLQTVIGGYNQDELPNMIDFCIVNGLDIKLFDLSSYDNALAGSAVFAHDNFVSLSEIAMQLEREFGPPTIKHAVGGYGHAKKVFTTAQGTLVEVRDVSVGSHFSEPLCAECPNYPCEEGISNLVLAADGHLRFCRRGGVEQTLSTSGAETHDELKTRFEEALGVFAVARTDTRRVRLPISPV